MLVIKAVLVVILSFLALHVNAGNRAQMILCVDHFPPLQIIREDGSVTGENVVVVEALITKLGYSLAFTEDTPFSRCLNQLYSGTVDLMSGLLWSEERDSNAHLFLFDGEFNKAFFVRKGGPDIRSFADLQGLRVGSLRGVRQFKEFDEASADFFDKVGVGSIDAGLRMLAAGRLDVMVCSEFYCRPALQASPQLLDKLIQSDYLHQQNTETYIGLSRRSPHEPMASELEMAARAMFDSGEFLRIIQQFQRKHSEYYE